MIKGFFLGWVSAVAILEVVGDILFKEWTIQHKNYLLVLGIIFYMIATITWAFSLQYQSLSKAVVIFAILTLVVGALVGVFMYKEHLTMLNIVGIIFGLMSIIMLQI